MHPALALLTTASLLNASPRDAAPLVVAPAPQPGAVAPRTVADSPQEPSLGSTAVARPELEGGHAWVEHPLDIEIDVGIATPVGGLGIMLDYSPVRWVSVACGVGTNIVGAEGTCMARVRPDFRSANRAVALGVGSSLGPHSQNEVTRVGVFGVLFGPLSQNGESKVPTEYRWKLAQWINFEIGYESRTDSGAIFRAYVGMAKLLNPSDAIAYNAWPQAGKKHYDTNSFLPYAGIAFGFGLF